MKYCVFLAITLLIVSFRLEALDHVDDCCQTPRYRDFPVSSKENLFELSGAEKAKRLRRRPNERPPKSEIDFDVFGRKLILGGKLSVEYEERQDYAFGLEADDLEKESAELELEAFYTFSRYSAVFAELEGEFENEMEPETGESESESNWKRNQLWFFSGGWFDDSVGFQIGRQNFADDRTWWWDTNLDAIRLHYDTEMSHFELALAQQQSRVSAREEGIDPEQDRVLRIISSNTWLRENHEYVTLFFLLQQDNSNTENVSDVVSRSSRDKSDLDAVWIGARHQKRFKLEDFGRLYYWLDLGYFAGSETTVDYSTIDAEFSIVETVERRDTVGMGIDIGAMWKTKLPGDLTFSLCYAAGSGDGDPDDGVNTSYRQTGLQRNDDSFRGSTGFHYYGDLLRPELTNIGISTLGVGFHFLPQSSVELVFHNYRQIYAMDEVPGSRLDIDPDGESRDIGSEINLIVGVEEWQSLEMELVLARFQAGSAFGESAGKYASKLSFEMSYRF